MSRYHALILDTVPIAVRISIASHAYIIDIKNLMS